MRLHKPEVWSLACVCRPIVVIWVGILRHCRWNAPHCLFMCVCVFFKQMHLYINEMHIKNDDFTSSKYQIMLNKLCLERTVQHQLFKTAKPVLAG